VKWGLEVNVAKTKKVVFRKRGILKRNEHWVCNNERLETVDHFNYLCVTRCIFRLKMLVAFNRFFLIVGCVNLSCGSFWFPVSSAVEWVDAFWRKLDLDLYVETSYLLH